MRKSYIAFCQAFFGLLLFASCSDWFDVSPKTDLKADDLFSSESGFQSALTGIYLEMTSSSTYGSTMSFGLLDQLAQEYDYVPSGVTDISAIYRFSTGNAYGSKQLISSAWLGEYNIIANCNNLLKWLDAKGDKVLVDANERSMMRGEALAVRAFCHFDLLRAWGPTGMLADSTVLSQKAIPYRTVADNSKQPRLTARDVLNHIVADLEQARSLLSYEKGSKLTDSDRRFRFNYYAVTALLARASAYLSEKEKAVEYAKEVIDNCGLQLQTSNQNDPILFSECLVGLNLYKMDTELSGYWATADKFTTQLVISQQKFNALFEVSGSRRDDFRSKSSAFYTYDTQQLDLSKKYTTNSNAVIPLIRLPEMYYIICECTSDMQQARSSINQVRNRRGYSASLNEKFTDDEGRLNAINKEYRKEFYAEGQYWFFLKAHGITTIPYATDVQLSPENFVFPLPDNEVQYGWTEDQ